MATDADLVEAWRDGDKKAGRLLFDRHFDLIGRFFRSKAEADADDLVQQTFLRCLKNWKGLREGTQFRAYLLAIARNVMVDHMRKRARTPEMVDASVSCIRDHASSPSRIAAQKREYRLLLEALRCLPLDSQILLELSYWEQLSSRELGDVLGVPAPTIRSRLQRAREDLHQRLREVAGSRAEAESTFEGLEGWANAIREQLSPAPADG